MNTIRTRRSRIARLGVASVMVIGIGVSTVGPALASGDAAASGSTATMTSEEPSAQKGATTFETTAVARQWGAVAATNTAVGGQCTWGAKEKFKAATGRYPAFAGNAHEWDTTARNGGWTVVLDAEVRSIVVFEKGVQGASWANGHVAWVEHVEFRADGRWIHIVEMNWTGPWQWSQRVVKDVAGMSFILAP
ncbi:MAG TPA: CHAP domain-containing protein [Acidimicrobiales bacterium]|nr:CHAP domain-containing protein [Acidimicrobiales bacterium]